MCTHRRTQHNSQLSCTEKLTSVLSNGCYRNSPQQVSPDKFNMFQFLNSAKLRMKLVECLN